MRADRLVATLLLLQARGRVTAAEVADELEISERTARRDLEALAVAGLPIYSRQGRGGGWELLGGARTDLSGLNAAEARALFVVAGPESSATPELKAALRKLVRALPEPFRASAAAASSRVVIDPQGWGRSVRRAEPPHLSVLQRAVLEGMQVRLGYRGADGRTSDRVVHPLGLVTKGAVWYLVADTAAGMRTFRVDRVGTATLTDDPVVRPDGFDLAETWRRIAAGIDEHRSRLRCRALVMRGMLPVLRGNLGRRVHVVGDVDAERVEVEIGHTDLRVLALELAGFAHGMEVLEPAELRDHLAEVGAALVARYGVRPDRG